jgi:serine/threonine-protein kinase
MNLSPGSKLGPYEIIDLIGSGGMGEVWKARDTRLGRAVAIKKVKEQHSERFKQEAKTIAALNHTFICQLFDIGPDYLVLEYVEGKTLSSPLPEKEAVRLAIQIATALEAAHKKGIIHRDLKPANIMVTDEGSVKLLDFGLAKLYEQDGLNSNVQTAEFPPTQAGTVLGTIAYMSPEQAQGQPADARSDIFAFGLVLYEMLSGRRAFSGESPHVTVAALLRDSPPPLKASPSLEMVVSRCLAKMPSARYQTVSEIKIALEQVSQDMEAKSSTESQPSIAVLPFVNMSGDKEQEYFSDGLAEEIINVLAHIPGLRVAGRTSSFFFRGKDVEFAEIGERLNVDHILEGSVRKAGSRIRVTAQLIKVADGFHVWSERYDRDLTDVFAIQDEIAGAIAANLKVKLSTKKTEHRDYAPSLPAYEAYLKARHYQFKATPESLIRSKQYAEQAIALDPRFAQAHIQLGDYFLAQAGWGLSSIQEAMAAMRKEARNALDLDPLLPEAQAMLGVVAGVYDYDWNNAERCFALAMAREPIPPQVRHWYGYFYLFLIGKVQEALEEQERALRQDPLNIFFRLSLAACLLAAGRQEDADLELYKILELDENFVPAFFHLVISQAVRGMYAKAFPLAEKLYLLAPWYAPSIGLLAGLVSRTGDVSRAEGLLQRFAEERAYNAPVAYAVSYLLCGEVDKAVDWIMKAIEQRHPFILVLLRSPLGKMLHSSPRRFLLMKLLNLPETPAI